MASQPAFNLVNADGAPGSLYQGSLPVGATPLTGASGNVANASAVATLSSESGKTAYISGFSVVGAGATVGLPVLVTVTGLLGGTLTYVYSAAVGVLLPNTPLHVAFASPLPASALNTNIVVTCPALGAGSTHNAVVATGYKV